MVPSDGLPVSRQGEALVPNYLTAADDPWVTLLVDEHERFVGEPRRKLQEHLRGRLPFDAPAKKLGLAQRTLGKLYGAKVVAAVVPRKARARLFVASAGRPCAAEQVLVEVASELAVSPSELEDSLFADLPGERRIVAPEEPISTSELRLRANLRLVQALLERSTHVRVRLEGNARPVVRQAKLRGLICTVQADQASQSVRLDISGPLSLFKRTLVYGHALAELVPQLAWCNRYFLDADVAFAGGVHRLIVASGAPIFPARAAKRFDSRLEERFARDFACATHDWDIIREPEPIPVGRSLIFPDFALVRRRPPFDRWLVEIVGFWTADYLDKKLAVLRLAGLERLIICVDAARDCGDDVLPKRARVLRYAKKIDVSEVLQIIEASSTRPGP
jgi:predicted nuclease of restriction endonuclease-like RecB superfamily